MAESLAANMHTLPVTDIHAPTAQAQAQPAHQNHHIIDVGGLELDSDDEDEHPPTGNSYSTEGHTSVEDNSLSDVGSYTGDVSSMSTGLLAFASDEDSFGGGRRRRRRRSRYTNRRKRTTSKRTRSRRNRTRKNKRSNKKRDKTTKRVRFTHTSSKKRRISKR